MEIVELRWIDPTYTEELPHGELDKFVPVEMNTYGEVLVDSNEYLTVASTTVVNNRVYRHVLTMPRAAIVSIRRLDYDDKEQDNA